MKTFKEDEMIQEYIVNLCETNNISIDIRFECFADINRFVENNDVFYVDYKSYYAKDIDDIKQFFNNYLNDLWEEAYLPNHRIALYVRDIVDKDGWYDVIVGGRLFVDDLLLV